MNMLFWGITLAVVGKVMIAIAVILAHSQLAHEHRVDQKVIKSFTRERNISIVGIILIIAGYILEITFLGGFGHMFMCSGVECAAALGNILVQ